MAQHKWHKEIKAWADGAEIEYKFHTVKEWRDIDEPQWDVDGYEYRIKPKVKITGRVASNTWLEEHEVRIEALEKIVSPQPKEPQYLYVINDPKQGIILGLSGTLQYDKHYRGKIKLEDEDV